MRFQDRVVIVTGAARGIGAVTAEAFAREGARVAVVDLDGAAAESTAKRLRDGGADVLPCRADVAASADVGAMVDAVLGRWQRVDALVNNAGGFAAIRATEDIPDAEWEMILRSNLTSAFTCSRAVLPAMKRRRAGRIVNVSSVVARSGAVRTTAHYTAAKAGVIGFTRHLAAEVAEHGITVNAIAPGTTATERVVAVRSPEQREMIGKGTLVGRIAEVPDIVGWVLFLATPEAAYLTGLTLAVNGGRLMV